MVRLRLDAKGRLIGFEARPSENIVRRSPADDGVATNWSALFRLAELDRSRFLPAEPVTVPPSAFDERAAWTGSFEQERTEQVRVEAASWGGRPVYFSIAGDWQQTVSYSTGPYGSFVQVALGGLFVLFVAGSILLAGHNLRRGRADRRGAWIAAAAGFGLAVASGLLAAAHISTLWELHILVKLLSWAGFVAGLLSSLYLAIEPYVRLHWPNALISWSRFRAGRMRDPLVGSHVLIGIFTAVVFEAAFWALFAAGNRSIRTWQPFPAALESLDSSGRFAAMFFSGVGIGLFNSIAILLLVVLLRLFISRLWLADLLASVFVSSWVFVAYSNTFQSAILGTLIIAFIYLVLWILRGFGFMAALAAMITDQVLTGTAPIALSSWYAGRSLVILAVPAAVAAWSLWVVLSAYRREWRQWAT
jgi:hypothetical protein